MALLFMDGFDYADVNLYAQGGKWEWCTAGNVTGLAYGRNSSSGMKVNKYEYLFKNLPTATTLITNFWAKQASEVAQSWYGVRFLFEGSYQVSITAASDGTISARQGNYDGTILGSSSSGVFVWEGCYFEIKVVFHDTTGSIVVKVDDVTVISLTDVDTQTVAGGCDRVMISSGSDDFCYDDFVVCDDSGSTNNDWLGDVSVFTLLPKSNGTYTGLTPSAGSAYECVDDPILDLNDYVSGLAENDKGSFAYMVPYPGSTDVLALQQYSHAAKMASGTRKVRNFARVNGTDYPGADLAVSDDGRYLQALWEVNPDTSSAWTDAIVNGAEFGVEIRGV